MALRNLKSWAQYSKRWQKARLKEGLNPRRWNRFRHLSAKTRAQTNPYEYAKGKSVKTLSRERMLNDLSRRIEQLAIKHTVRNFGYKGFKPAGRATIRYRLDKGYGDTGLGKMDRMTDELLYRHIVRENRKIMEDGKFSPLFYHAGGNQ